jgi:hypothetical protein
MKWRVVSGWWLAILASCLLSPASCLAATYYVDNCVVTGNDANNGTSKLTPWLTVAKVNASSFSAGDSILFERACSWYGTALTAPSSGSSGNPITFGAYGTGANPIIKGSTLLNTAGYTLAAPLILTIFAPGDTGTNVSDSLTINMREDLPASYNGHPTIASSAQAIYISLTASPTAAMNVTGAGIGPVTTATAPNTNSVTRITWNGGSSGITIPAGQTATSDRIVYNLNNAVEQIVTIYTTSRNLEYFGQYGTNWEKFSGPDESQLSTVSGYTQPNGNSPIAAIAAFVVPQVTYTAVPAFNPVAMWENGTLMQLQSLETQVEAIPGTFYYDGTNLFILASDGSNIATNGKAYSYVTASSPGYTGWDNANSWLIFDSVDEAETYNTSSANLNTLGGLILTGANNIVRNLSVHDNYRHDFSVYTGATNCTLTNITGYNSYGTSPVTIYGPGTTGNLVQKSTFYNDTYLQERYNFIGDFWTVVVAHGGSTSNTVDSNIIYSTAGACIHNCISGKTSHGYGVLVGDSGTTLTASHNLIYGTFEWGVLVGNYGSSGLGDAANVTLWDNLIDISQIGSTNDGLQAGILIHGSTGSIVYNNTVYGPAVAAPAIQILGTSTGALVKNNIFQTRSGATVDASSESGAQIDYNDWFGQPGIAFVWGATGYAFGGWQAASSQDAHSIVTDPKLTNASPLPGGNYTLNFTSGAIGAGINLGGTYQNELLATSVWPGGVTTAAQPSSWTMGAYLMPKVGLPGGAFSMGGKSGFGD